MTYKNILRLSALVCAFALWASPSYAGQRLDAEYGFYWKGILVASAETGTFISDEAYDLSINFRMRGIAKIFSNGRSALTARGHFDENGAPVPVRYTSDGRWDGKDYAQTLTFDENGVLVDQQLDWPKKWLEENKREPVPDEMQVGPDPVSVIIQLIQTPITIAADGTPIVVRTFDGDSVMDWLVSCEPEPVILEESGKSPFSGAAHECGFSAELKAGERILTEKQKKKAEKRRRKEEKRRAKGKEDEEKPPKLWVQPVAGGQYYLPVRAEATTGMGRVVMHLKNLNITDADVSASQDDTYAQTDTGDESQD